MWLSEDLATSLVAEAATRPGPEHRLAVCARYGVSIRTLERWEAKSRSSVELAAIVERKKKAGRARWDREARDTMVELLAAIRRVLPNATIADLRMLAGGVKVVGELLVSRDIFPAARTDDGEHDSPSPRNEAAPRPDAARSGDGAPPIH